MIGERIASIRELPSERRRLGVVLVALFLIYIGLSLWLTLHTGIRFDYELYADVWSNILSGLNPWSGNTESLFPPFFQFLAPLYAVSPLLPKLVFWGAAVTVIGILLTVLYRGRIKRTSWIFLLCGVILLNPYFPLFTYSLGTMDALVALFVLLSVMTRTEGHNFASGLLLAIAAMLKVHPLFLLPLLAWEPEKRKVVWRFLLGFGLGCSFGVIPAAFLWGGGLWDSVRHAVQYEAEILSLFAFFVQFPPLRASTGAWLQSHYWLITLSTIIAWLTVTACAIRWRTPLVVAVPATMMVVFAFFQIGHVQYLCVVVTMILYGLAGGLRLEAIYSRSKLFWLYFVWLHAVFVYYGTAYNEFSFLDIQDISVFRLLLDRDIVGLPHTIVTIAAVTVLFYRVHTERLNAATPTAD